MTNSREEILYAYDHGSQRFYGAVPVDDALYLADLEFPDRSPLVLIRLIDLLQENRFCQVASTLEAA